MRTSRLRRKELNRLRNQSDVPWPARKYVVTPTFGDTITKNILVGQCSRKVAEGEVTEGKFLKKTKTVDIPCQGNVYVKRGSLGKRRVYCEDCRARAAQRKLALRFQKRAARISPQEQIAEQRKEVSRFKRFMRKAGK